MEKEPDLTKMGRLFLIAVVFMKIPVIYFGTKIAETEENWPIIGLLLSIAFSLFSMIYFIIKD
ncbi:MAG: hypothetical protein NZM25_05700 [Leptospiraceae bacterium]|nr:hypothetical protein [Leptospiraceae bacterium]MDW8306541.1 hypothetical protein [Leptospiraceae bacterium]